MGIFDFLKKKNIEEENTETVIENENLEDVEQIEDEIVNIEDEILEEVVIEDEILEEEVIEEEVLEEEILEDEILEDEILEDEILEDEILEEIENPEVEEETFETEDAEKPTFFKKMFSGLEKTRKNILSSVENVFKKFTKIDEEMFEELEEVLILSDIGTETSVQIIEAVKERVRKEKATEVSAVKELLYKEITEILEEENDELVLKKPTVILVIGVNGVGKTTTIGKLANNYKNEGNKVLLAAADTFRAAAIDQLEIWGSRSGIDTIKHQENSDPGAVIFDAVAAAKARKIDVLICDTAGRLHNKKNLMDELKKIFKIISQNFQDAQLEVFLVLDATTGQNALQQAKAFKEAANITGIVLTKLDGTAKGGIVIAIKNELKVPVRFIGVGEGIDDLQKFDASQFAKALFDEKA